MKLIEILADETRWSQGAMARNKGGVPVPWWSEEAYSFDLFGAFLKCYHNQPDIMLLLSKVRQGILDNYSQTHIENWLALNDAPGMTYNQIVDICERTGL